VCTSDADEDDVLEPLSIEEAEVGRDDISPVQPPNQLMKPMMSVIYIFSASFRLLVLPFSSKACRLAAMMTPNTRQIAAVRPRVLTKSRLTPTMAGGLRPKSEIACFWQASRSSAASVAGWAAQGHRSRPLY